MPFKFDCIFYYVSDMPRTIRFYRDLLGLRLLSQDIVARFELDGVMIEVVPTTEKSKLQGEGNGRLCLQIENMDAALAELAGKGIAATPPMIKEGGVLASFSDPDGNEICLWQYTQQRQALPSK
ncbi:MAG TPA: VOC family protein [Terriglobales bacterium]|nr:VOC family protein [Terriglobales bacterium]